jgi:hypothetical protein
MERVAREVGHLFEVKQQRPPALATLPFPEKAAG